MNISRTKSCPKIKKRNNIPGTKIPKIIWSFWDSENPPETVKFCMDSWSYWNPDYLVILLNKKNVNDYIPKVNVLNLRRSSDFPARLSDLIRINILKKYGGLWTDATNLATMSFDLFVKENILKNNRDP